MDGTNKKFNFISQPDYVIGYISGAAWGWENKVSKARQTLKEIREIIDRYTLQREQEMKKWTEKVS